MKEYVHAFLHGFEICQKYYRFFIIYIQILEKIIEIKLKNFKKIPWLIDKLQNIINFYLKNI